MPSTLPPRAKARLMLMAETAADLMTPNPVSLEADATLRQALELLTDRGFSAAPVIDEAGRPVGVLSRTDLLVHDREEVTYLKPAPGPGETGAQPADQERVRDVMTPAVFSVALEAPAARVVEQLVALKVHRLFVVDEGGALVGVISAFDVLRHLRLP